MRKQFAVIVVVATFCLAAGAWAFGQVGWRHGPSRGRSSLRPNTFLIDDVDPRRVQIRRIDPDDGRTPSNVRAVKPIQRGPVGRYAVAEGDDCTLLVDTMTGNTWILCPAASGHPGDAAWLPIRRIDDPDEASRWRNRQKEQKEKRPERRERKRR